MKKTELATKEEVVWFEKTVEYKFITDCLEKRIIESIMPLSGFREQVGDTITALRDAFKKFKFYIIEFKKDLGESGFKLEVNEKFTTQLAGYNAAKTCFNDDLDNPLIKGHYFISAQYKENKFQLIARDYFEPDRKVRKTLDEAFSSKTGMTQEEFALYVNRFTSHKKTNKCYKCPDSGNGGSTVTSPAGPNPRGRFGLNVEKDISVVIAINPDNKECITFPLTLVQLTDGLGGLPVINISPDVGGGGGDEVVVHTELIITHPHYFDPELGELSRPDDIKEEITS